ncbi:MAG: heat shock protein HspQ [Myxococcales bacterium]|nr:heat shock protein HspQ [Myxococcales bacterium]
MSRESSQFRSGQIVIHKRYGYRGVIVSVDDIFEGSEDWYEAVAVTRPAKDRPWYHVLVDESAYETYVAEAHLMTDFSDEPIDHPLVEVFWDDFEDGQYSRDQRIMN